MQKGYRSVNDKKVAITDPLFAHYVDMIADAVLPYQWEVLNDRVEGAEKSHGLESTLDESHTSSAKGAKKSHCLENFRIAAGLSSGSHYGTVFLDTDVYKWLEAVAFCVGSGKGERFVSLADEVIDLIAQAQQPDGYLNTYFTIVKPEARWTNLVEGHELYCAGHLIEAAVAYYEATGKRKILDVAMRFADLIAKTFGTGEGQIRGYPGHQEVEVSLVKLYRTTGERRYLESARYFIAERGSEPNYFLGEIEKRGGKGIFPELQDYDLKYSQSHMPPVKQRDIEGHAVRAMYMCATMADLALEFDDGEMRDACEALWLSATKKRMFITGGIGSSGFLERFTADYDLPNDATYCETCASVGLMMFGQRMASLTGDASYYDAVELALHNTVLAGINADGRKYFYVNALETWPSACLPHTSMRHVKAIRQDWFDVACCPTNIARTLASLGRYVYATDDESLYVHQFISSRATAEIGGKVVSVDMKADIVRGGKVTIRTTGAAKLRVRIPSWADKPEYRVDGKRASPRIEKNYACFELAAASEISMDFHVEPRWVAANGQVRADAGKTALMLGPFVYCLEEADNSENLASVFVALAAKVAEGGALKGLPGGMPSLEYNGYRMESGVKSLYGKPDYSMKAAKLTAVPYCLWCNRKPGEMLVWQKVRL